MTFQTRLCDSLFRLIDCDDLVFDVRNFGGFGTIVVEPKLDEEGNLADTAFRPGDAGEIVMVRVSYRWQFATPYFGHLVSDNDSNSNSRLLLATGRVPERAVPLRCTMRFLSGLARDTRGLAATEFALTLPFVLLLLLGATEITNLLLADRKLVAATQTADDLVTQERAVSNADLSDIFRSAELVMQPYDEADLRIGIASVRFSLANGTPVLDWQAQRRAGRVIDPLITTRDLGTAGESVIIVSLAYRYRPIFATLFTDSFELTESAFSRPRRGALAPVQRGVQAIVDSFRPRWIVTRRRAAGVTTASRLMISAPSAP